jgi:hypothetical protein
LIRSKAFSIGFLCGLALFAAANIYSYLQVVPPCCDFFGPFGVPLEIGGYGGFAGQTYILWSGVLANALIAVFVSVVLGWTCHRSFMCRGVASDRLRRLGRESAA